MKQPLITVLMPAYNAEKYIDEAIRSVLVQTFTDFELLIVNDGSTDNTKQMIESYDDPRIRLINQTNRGIASALNIGLLNAKADLIARFDADDICMPERLQVQYEFLKDNPDHIIVGSDADYMDMNGEYVFTCGLPAYSNEEIQDLAFHKCPFIHSAVLFRKAFVLQAGGYNENAYAFQDHLLWAMVIKQGKAGNLRQKLILVRLCPESTSIDEKWRTKRFRQIKHDSIERGYITEEEGKEILGILKKQNNNKIKKGSYYSLLAKKYLFNNYDRPKARENIFQLIQIYPMRIQGYLLYGLSLLPKYVMKMLYKTKRNKPGYAKAT